MRHHFLSFLLLVVSATIVIGQSQPDAANNWQRYTDKDEEFSVLLPELPGAFEDFEPVNNSLTIPKRIGRYYAAYGNGVVFFVMSYQKSSKFRTFNDVAGLIKAWHFTDVDQGAQQKSQANGMEIIQITQLMKDTTIVGRFYEAKKHFYYLRVVGEKEQIAAMQGFFDSFTLSQKSQGQAIGAGGRLNDYAPPTVNNSDATNKPKVEDIVKAGETTRKALILLKPSPLYTENARRDSIEGVTRLRVLLGASGRVTKTEVVKSLRAGLDKNAIAATRKIYFLPAQKDGRRVSQWVQIEYEFNLY